MTRPHPYPFHNPREHTRCCARPSKPYNRHTLRHHLKAWWARMRLSWERL